MTTGVLVVAKAPVTGLAKTRIAIRTGNLVAAELAAASLLDTMDVVEGWVPTSGRLMALTGDLTDAVDGAEIGRRLTAWTVVDQRGRSFAERLVAAHHDAAALWGGGGVVVQIGMDTPGIKGSDLDALAAAVTSTGSSAADAALGPASDGGWWGLATRRAGYVDGLVNVAMSQPDTGERTATALGLAGARVRLLHELRDVDRLADVLVVAGSAPGTRFARAAARSMASIGGQLTR